MSGAGFPFNPSSAEITPSTRVSTKCVNPAVFKTPSQFLLDEATPILTPSFSSCSNNLTVEG